MQKRWVLLWLPIKARGSLVRIGVCDEIMASLFFVLWLCCKTTVLYVLWVNPIHHFIFFIDFSIGKKSSKIVEKCHHEKKKLETSDSHHDTKQMIFAYRLLILIILIMLIILWILSRLLSNFLFYLKLCWSHPRTLLVRCAPLRHFQTSSNLRACCCGPASG